MSIMTHRTRALDALKALGPVPTLPRRGPGRPRHPDAEAWERQAAEIGRAFFLAVWRDACSGDTFCRGYVEAMLFPNKSVYDERSVTDEMVAAYAAAITPRWTESLRAMEG